MQHQARQLSARAIALVGEPPTLEIGKLELSPERMHSSYGACKITLPHDVAQRENAMPIQSPHELFEVYRIRKVSNITGLARSTIYGLIKDGKFPKPIKLSVRAVGWSSLSVFQWLAERDVVL